MSYHFSWTNDVVSGRAFTITPDPMTSAGPYLFTGNGPWIIDGEADAQSPPAGYRVKKSDSSNLMFIPASMCSFKLY